LDQSGHTLFDVARANRPERTRQLNRARAFEALAARYPSDDEAQIFYALYLASTQSLADQRYQTYLKAAAQGPARRATLRGHRPSAPHALHMP
jgi:hypothetical protein